MARLLKPKLLLKLKSGEFQRILECVNNDPHLSFEVRTAGVAMVYYKKSKVLSLFSKRKDPKILAEGYWKGDEQPSIDIQKPHDYFNHAKTLVDKHKKKNVEFTIQQKIMSDNNTKGNQFLVVDMEYQFAQDIVEVRTKKKTRFDLVALDLMNDKIVLFELKQGFSSSEGKSGITDHLSKFTEHINHPEFRKFLISDLKSIIEIKELLGVYTFDSTSILQKLDKAIVEFKIIFGCKDQLEKQRYQLTYGDKHKTLFVNISDSNYRLTAE